MSITMTLFAVLNDRTPATFPSSSNPPSPSKSSVTQASNHTTREARVWGGGLANRMSLAMLSLEGVLVILEVLHIATSFTGTGMLLDMPIPRS